MTSEIQTLNPPQSLKDTLNVKALVMHLNVWVLDLGCENVPMHGRERAQQRVTLSFDNTEILQALRSGNRALSGFYHKT